MKKSFFKQIFCCSFLLFSLTSCFFTTPPESEESKPETMLVFNKDSYDYEINKQYELDYSWINKDFNSYTNYYHFNFSSNNAEAKVEWVEESHNDYTAKISAAKVGTCKLKIVYRDSGGSYESNVAQFKFGYDQYFDVNFYGPDGKTLLKSNHAKPGETIEVPTVEGNFFGWRKGNKILTDLTKDLQIYESKDYYAVLDNGEGTEGLIYKKLSNGTLSVTGYDGFYEDIVVPTVHEGLVVSAIGDSAFKNRSIGEISLPSTIEEIGSNAFCDSKVERINIPNVSILKEIGLGAFYNCDNLTWILIPLTVSYIDSNAFSNADISVLFETENYESISKGYSLFSGNDASSFLGIDSYAGFDSTGNIEYFLTKNNKAAILDCKTSNSSVLEITEVDGYPVAFVIRQSSDISTVSEIVIGPSVSVIGNYSFYNCDNLRKVDFSNATSLHTIGTNAFEDCDNIEIIDLLNCKALKKIYSEAFASMESLRYITIPESVTTIQYSSFDTNNLICLYGHSEEQFNNISFDYNVYGSNCFVFNNIKKVVEQDATGTYMYALNNNDQVLLLEYFKEIDTSLDLRVGIDGFSIYGIGPSLFESCINLVEVFLPQTITIISSYAFKNCLALKYVHNPVNSSLTSIGKYAFENCGNLIYLHLTKGLKSIGTDAFKGTDGLQLLVEKIDLNDVSFSSAGGYSLVYGVKEVRTHAVGQGKLFYYETHSGELGAIRFVSNLYYNYAPTSDIELTEIEGKPFTYICSKTFYNLVNSTGTDIKITIGKNIECIASNAFAYFYAPKTGVHEAFYIIEIEENSSLEKIGTSAFAYGRRLGDLVIPETVTSIGKEAFYDSVYHHNLFMEKTTSNNVSLGSNWSKNCTVYWGNQWQYNDSGKPVPIS